MVFLLNPITSDALVPAAREAKQAGIPVFCTNRDISDPKVCVLQQLDRIKSLLGELQQTTPLNSWRNLVSLSLGK